MKASTELPGAVSHLMAMEEPRPELKANQNSLHLQQLSAVEKELANHRWFYNDAVLNYDRLLETVPTDLIAKMFHFKKEELFKVGKPKRLRLPFSFDLGFRGEEVAL